MIFNHKIRHINILFYFFFIIDIVSGRDFSANLIDEYQTLVRRSDQSKKNKSIACVNIDILILLMSEASSFDIITMRKIRSNPALFISDSFYQNWKQNIIGQIHTDTMEKEITRLEKLENIKLLDKKESRTQWINLIRKTEEIIQEVGKSYGYKIILKQNTISTPYSFNGLNRYSIVSKNISNITLIVAKYILQKRGLSSDYIDKILVSIRKSFIF